MGTIKQNGLEQERAAVFDVEGVFRFFAGGSEVLRLEENGNIYVNGRLAANDMEVVEGLRAFVRAAKSVA